MEKKIFSYEEALATFADVKRRTEAAVKQVESLLNEVKNPEELRARQEELTELCEGIYRRWAKDIAQRHGCEAKGLWMVDWDSGGGYYCWQYPEEILCHFHEYDAGFEGRIPIQ
jgi:hypothetical protein